MALTVFSIFLYLVTSVTAAPPLRASVSRTVSDPSGDVVDGYGRAVDDQPQVDLIRTYVEIDTEYLTLELETVGNPDAADRFFWELATATGNYHVQDNAANGRGLGSPCEDRSLRFSSPEYNTRTVLVPVDCVGSPRWVEVNVVSLDYVGSVSVRDWVPAKGQRFLVGSKPAWTRLAGDDRIGTAVAVSQHLWSSATTAVIARADHFADALAGTPYAAEFAAPLLLSHTESLPSAVLDELKRLQVTDITILGGTAAISQGVQDELERRGYQVVRVAGGDRFETAAAMFGNRPPPAKIALATGLDFPDALTSATTRPKQTLLVATGAIPKPTSDLLHEPSVESTDVFGGTVVITESVTDELREVYQLEVNRISGSDRYETSLEGLTASLATYGSGPLFITTGQGFPDALSAGPALAHADGHLLLVPPTGLPQSAATFLENNRDQFSDLLVVGGTTAIPDALAQQVATALGK